MAVYDYDSTAILAEPIKIRSEREILRAYSKLHQHLPDRGLKPQIQKLDNECSAALKQFLRKDNVEFQLVPPYNHRQNAAEQAIGIWKDHFVAGLASLDPTFPMHLWCRLIEQCTQTLNLMRPSRINPRLSAEAQLNTTKLRLRLPARKFSSTKPPTDAAHGPSMVLTDGTSVEHQSTTDAIEYMPPKLESNASHAPWNFFHITDKCLNSPQRMPPFRPLSTSAGPFTIPPLRPP
jgi:hypothetical protein